VSAPAEDNRDDADAATPADDPAATPAEDPAAPSVGPTPAEVGREHAEFHARADAVGVGASVTRSDFENGERFWECIVTDGREWHYIRIYGDDVGAFPPFSDEDIEAAVERFALSFPEAYRLRALLNANPLHLDPNGEIRD
jgi:hypothetical protein